MDVGSKTRVIDIENIWGIVEGTLDVMQWWTECWCREGERKNTGCLLSFQIDQPDGCSTIYIAHLLWKILTLDFFYS